ncbi:hypothetical protein JW710_05125 [Candidatus Dojkabacteria bacterium]|nr:hypothetical protein [Candidatus Dojkabacteria bacterium]
MGKKQILLIVAGVAVVLLIGAVVAVKVFILPPSADKVCEHMRDLTVDSVKDVLGGEEEAQDYVDEEMPQDECVDELKEDAEKDGLLETKKTWDCILKADDLEEMIECD